MTLIKSISGIRGTIGGRVGDNLTPIDIVKFAAAFGTWISTQTPDKKTIIVGRDARTSGKMVSDLVCSTLNSLGFDIIDLGLSTTPTVEIAVPKEGAAGGIILTASHNPAQWNALKLLNADGEFISDADGKALIEIADTDDYSFAGYKDLGSYRTDDTYLKQHIDSILALPTVDIEAIKKANFRVVVDAVNSTGGIAVPMLLRALGVHNIKEINCEPTGLFAHNPEPIPENLREISGEVKRGDYDLGIVVDPDVDRLAFISEDGEPFGEEYTLVAVADYLLSHEETKNKATVSNLSSTISLKEITEKHGGEYHASAVGEVNVVTKMKEVGAEIGGEGNGGIIYPALHYGRDALVGIALFLSHLAHFGKSIGHLRKQYPNYFIAKKKANLEEGLNVDKVLEGIKKKYSKQPVNTVDGVKIMFGDSEWVHLRKSNTEPIVRIYAESEFENKANSLADKIIKDINEVMKEG
jgi:phosphomannomutase